MKLKLSGLVRAWLLILPVLIPYTVTSQTDTVTRVLISEQKLGEIVTDLKLYELCQEELKITDSLLTNTTHRLSVSRTIANSYQKELDFRDSIRHRDSLIHRRRKAKLKEQVSAYKKQRNIAGGVGLLTLLAALLLN